MQIHSILAAKPAASKSFLRALPLISALGLAGLGCGHAKQPADTVSISEAARPILKPTGPAGQGLVEILEEAQETAPRLAQAKGNLTDTRILLGGLAIFIQQRFSRLAPSPLWKNLDNVTFTLMWGPNMFQSEEELKLLDSLSQQVANIRNADDAMNFHNRFFEEVIFPNIAARNKETKEKIRHEVIGTSNAYFDLSKKQTLASFTQPR